MKKIATVVLSVALSIVLALSGAVVGSAGENDAGATGPGPFTTPARPSLSLHPATEVTLEDEIAWMKSQGYIVEQEDGSYHLDDSLTRLEYAAVVVRVLGMEREAHLRFPRDFYEACAWHLVDHDILEPYQITWTEVMYTEMTFDDALEGLFKAFDVPMYSANLYSNGPLFESKASYRERNLLSTAYRLGMISANDEGVVTHRASITRKDMAHWVYVLKHLSSDEITSRTSPSLLSSVLSPELDASDYANIIGQIPGVILQGMASDGIKLDVRDISEYPADAKYDKYGQLPDYYGVWTVYEQKISTITAYTGNSVSRESAVRRALALYVYVKYLKYDYFVEAEVYTPAAHEKNEYAKMLLDIDTIEYVDFFEIVFENVIKGEVLYPEKCEGFKYFCPDTYEAVKSLLLEIDPSVFGV